MINVVVCSANYEGNPMLGHTNSTEMLTANG